MINDGTERKRKECPLHLFFNASLIFLLKRSVLRKENESQAHPGS
jgi:hypothetical protein